MSATVTDFTIEQGYDYMALMQKRGAQPMSCWGADGWDLGDWPYVCALYQPKTHRVTVYVEGDLTHHDHGSQDEAFRTLDGIAAFYWRRDPERYGSEMVAVVAEHPEGDLPKRFRGPYRRN